MGDDTYAHKPLVDRLEVKPGSKVAVVGVHDDRFVRDVEEVTGRRVLRRPGTALDLLFVGVDRIDELRRLAALRRSLAPNGALWVVRPKGKGGVPEAEVMAAGKAAGLVDVKVARFSDTHTAEKFVIPVASR